MQGAPPTLDAWLDATLPRINGLAYALTGDRDAAQDLSQEALATVVRKWRTVSRADNPTAYARTLVVNTFLSHRRRRWTSEVVSHDLVTGPGAGRSEGLDERVATRSDLLDAVRSLPPRQRAAVALRYYEDLDDSAIASAMGCSVSTVRTSIHHALKSLRASGVGRDLTEAPS